MNKFHEEKTILQLVSRTNFSMPEISRTKSTRSQFPEENKHATISTNKFSFTKKKSMNKFHEEKNQHATSFTNKNQYAKCSNKNNGYILVYRFICEGERIK